MKVCSWHRRVYIAGHSVPRYLIILACFVRMCLTFWAHALMGVYILREVRTCGKTSRMLGIRLIRRDPGSCVNEVVARTVMRGFLGSEDCIH